MAKVSLRVYNREIESLIDQGHLQEAIAHCRHVLQSFPKHLETYRLLGKAYLEAKRSLEAVDVFSRVLMAVPDDFVAHVGMSIIRDDQNKLDDAIWHMERAFEAQPSNAAIQAELQRLFGRRDGSQPPKIRMTRGALAHMYIQGELYPQAISEIKAVLAQDNQREDMKALLARAYFYSGQRADASDICSQLLNHYAYSFDANRIMLELLRGSESAENVQAYRQRVHELDPYSAFTDGSVFRSNEVSDAAVSLEHLEYRGQEVDLSPDWEAASAGPAGAPQEQDWLSAGLTPAAEEEPLSPVESVSEIPDFMRQAGWREASGTGQEPPPSYEAGPEITSEDELTPADMPGWLKAMAPGEGETAAPVPPASDMPEWLGGLSGETPASGEVADIPAWLQGLDETEPEAGLHPEDSGLPEWLRSTAESAPIEPEAGMQPGLDEQEPFEELTPLKAEALEEEDFFKFEAPEESMPIEAGEAMIEPEAPIAELPVETGTFPEPIFVEPEAPEEPTFITPEPLASEPAFVELEVVEEPAPITLEPFLQPLTTEPEVSPEAIFFESEAPGELTPIEPVLEPEPAPIAQETLPEEAVLETPEVGPVTPLPSIATLGMSAQEQDDAMAWLESLAAKHGAKSEEFVTDPSARSEKPPAWVEQARALSESQAAVTEPFSETPAPGEAPAIETPAPVEEPAVEMPAFTGEFASEVSVSPEQPAPEEPASVEELPVEEQAVMEPVSEIPAPAEELEPLPGAVDETDAWLRELTVEEEKPREFEEKEFAAESAELEDEGLVSDMPDWLSRADSIARTTEDTQPVTPIQVEKTGAEVPDLPAWLSGLDEEKGWPAPASLGDELPSWLQAEQEPSVQAEPTAPTDWRSVESETEPQPEIPPSMEPGLEQRLSELEALEKEQVEPLLPETYEPEPEPEPVVLRQPAPPASKKAPMRPAAERRQPGFQASVSDPELAAARSELKRSNIPSALEHYSRLIKKGRWLEEIIRDLREALYRYPVEVTVWQTLGDAYMRENRLQEALDSYTKAEELLR